MRVRLVVSDLARSERFYTRHLGLEVVERQSRDGTLVSVAVHGRGATLELASLEEAGRLMRMPSSSPAACPVEIVLESADIRQDGAALDHTQADTRTHHRIVGPTTVELALSDPDGYSIVLRQHLEDGVSAWV